MTDIYTHPSPVTPVRTEKIRTQLLKDKVARMKLDPDAKFLSQQDEAIKAAQDHKQMILAWRRAQEKVTLQRVTSYQED